MQPSQRPLACLQSRPARATFRYRGPLCVALIDTLAVSREDGGVSELAGNRQGAARRISQHARAELVPVRSSICISFTAGAEDVSLCCTSRRLSVLLSAAVIEERTHVISPIHQ